MKEEDDILKIIGNNEFTDRNLLVESDNKTSNLLNILDPEKDGVKVAFKKLKGIAMEIGYRWSF